MDIRQIEEALKKPGKTKSGLAKALGRQPSAVTALLSGERELKAREIPIIEQYLEINGAAQKEHRAGNAVRSTSTGEADLVDVECVEDAKLRAALKALMRSYRRGRVEVWELKTDAMEGAGYREGDYLIVDLGADYRQPGTVVLALQRPSAGAPPCAMVRAYFPPILFSIRENPYPPLTVDNEKIIIKGVVTRRLK